MTIDLENEMSEFKGCERKYVLSRSKMYLQFRISQEFRFACRNLLKINQFNNILQCYMHVDWF